MRHCIASLCAAATAAMLLAGCAKEPRAPAGAVRILPLGDSITQAVRGRDSWRRELWLALREAGHEVDFVGTQRQNHWGPPPHRDFDMDHEGHWGWRADEVLDGLDKWLGEYTPDIVLLHIGTNDLGNGEKLETVVDEVRQVIGKLRGANPNVTVLLAKIVPIANPLGATRIRAFNTQLEALARSLSTGDAPVQIVDQYDGFDARRDTYDGIHPNEAGNAKMAKKWFEALMAVL